MWITSFRYFRIIFHLTVSPIISPLTSHSVFPTCTTFFSRSSFSPNSSLSLLPLLSKFSPQNRTKQRAPPCSREAFPREPFFLCCRTSRTTSARMLRAVRRICFSLSGPVSQWRNASASGSRFDRSTGRKSFRSFAIVASWFFCLFAGGEHRAAGIKLWQPPLTGGGRRREEKLVPDGEAVDGQVPTSFWFFFSLLP